MIEKGSESLLSAIEVGIAIEELDIKDLEELISQTDNPTIIRVYENLLAGSENHLEAFNSQYNRYQNPDDVQITIRCRITMETTEITGTMEETAENNSRLL